MNESDLIIAMTNAGIVPELVIAIITDGRIHRFKIRGDKAGTRNGWYVVNTLPKILVIFGNWKTNAKHIWSPYQPQKYAAKQSYLPAFSQYPSMQNRAPYIWERCNLPDPSHSYLINKKVNPYGIKQSGNNLIIPLRNRHQLITSLQFISPNGFKCFLKKSSVKESFHQINGLTDTIYIVEGYATGATIHNLTNKCVIIAFNTSNLKSVGKIIKFQYPNSKIIFAADNDSKTSGNPGLKHAIAAAESIKADITWPTFIQANQGTDFNDLFT